MGGSLTLPNAECAQSLFPTATVIRGNIGPAGIIYLLLKAALLANSPTIGGLRCDAYLVRV